MIHPTSSSVHGSAGVSHRMRFVFYLCGLLFTLANFFPLLSKSPLLHRDLPTEIVYQLIFCYILSLPLLLELFADILIAKIAKSHLDEYHLGYFILLLSLFLPVILIKNSLVDAQSDYSILFTNCFISFLQSIVIIAQYDWLIVVTGQWSIFGCLLCSALFVGSQTTQNYAIAYSPTKRENKYSNSFLFVSFVLGILCLIAHMVYSKHYIRLFCSYCCRSKEARPTLDTNSLVGAVLQSSTALYIIVTIITTLTFFGDFVSRNLLIDVVTHIVLVLCISIIPGRIIRKKLFLANVSLVVLLVQSIMSLNIACRKK